MSKEFSSNSNQPEQVALPDAWGLGPGHLGPSFTGDYPPYPAITGEVISARFDPPAEEQQATAYMQSVLPGVDTELISTKGSTAVVLGDDTTAYKIMRRQPWQYDTVENEAATISWAHQAGLGPELRALIDADELCRQNALDAPTPILGGEQQIVRVNGHGPAPILAIERLDLAPLDELPADRIAEEFARFAEVVLGDNIRLQDVEIYAERAEGRAVAIDAGYAQQLSLTKENAGVIVCSLMESFSPRGTHLPLPEETVALFEEKGIAGVKAMFAEQLRIREEG